MNDFLRLYTNSDSFIFESQNSSSYLLIDRSTQKIQATEGKPQLSPQDQVQDIYGIFGVINLLAGPYLILIRGRKQVGKILGHNIYQVTRWEILPFSKTNLTQTAKDDEAEYLRMVKEIMDLDSYYYSPTYDLSQSYQRNKTELKNDRTFVWNEELIRPFQDQQLSNWVVPVILGFVRLQEFQSHQHPFQWALVSRRSNKRVGTRFNVRGIDQDANVANYVETEIIVEKSGQDQVGSYVQTRGSIPVYWNQTVNAKYKPPLSFPRSEQEDRAIFADHLDQQIEKYGQQLLVCLIDQKGSELKLFTKYQQLSQLNSNKPIQFYGFDFHKECKNLKFDRVSLLLDQVKPKLSEIGYFFVEGGTVSSSQKGVIRTNCMDNLDRTNVVQAMFAREALGRILNQMGLFDSNELQSFQNSSPIPSFDHSYRNTWADHADVISLQYSGTGALKTDFTRTGKRTVQGLLSDGQNSVTRYYLNNFRDGFRQDAYDLMTGNYKVDPQNPRSPFVPRKRARDNLFLLVVFSVVILALVSFVLPDADTGVNQAIRLAGWALSLGGLYFLGISVGSLIVDHPTFSKFH